MIETIVVILVVAAALLVGALVFGGWLIVAVVRLISRALGGGRPAGHALPAPPSVRCLHPRCRAGNPASARFCRRCGKMLHVPEPAAARQVAMW